MSADHIEEEDGIGLPLDDCFDSDRFLPQMDHQVIGPDWIARRKDANLMIGNLPPALPPSDPLAATVYCESCQLTWLRGFNAERHGHPLHNAVERGAAGPGRSLRSLVVRIGASTSAGKTTYSAYFGPGSKYNFAGVFGGSEATLLNAQLEASARALDAVKGSVLSDIAPVLEQNQVRSEDDDSEDVHFRVLLTTDSAFLVDNICDSFHDTTKLPLEIVEKFDELYGELEDAGLELQWYLVPKEQNEDANGLAATASA